MISLIPKNETRYSHLSLHNATVKDLVPNTPCNFHLLLHPGSVAIQPFTLLCFSSPDISSLVHLVSLLIWNYVHTSKFISKVRPHKHICFLNSLLPSNSFQEKNFTQSRFSFLTFRATFHCIKQWSTGISILCTASLSRDEKITSKFYLTIIFTA